MAQAFGHLAQEEQCWNLDRGDGDGAVAYEAFGRETEDKDEKHQAQDTASVEEELAVKQVEESM